MENKLQIFNHTEFGNIRTIEENGKLLFCGKDIAQALGYGNPREAIRDFCPHGAKRSIGVQTGTKADGTPAVQMVETTFIPEGDVYRLIVRSKLPAAEKFERWLFDEVAPAVIKTGVYVDGKTMLRQMDEMIRDPQGYAKKKQEDSLHSSLLDTELITQVATATAAAIMQQLLPLLRTTKPQEDDFDTEYIQLQEVRRRRNRASSVISQLDAGLRQEVEEMLCSHKFSYTDVVQMLREQGIKISTSSVCNYAKKHGIFPV